LNTEQQNTPQTEEELEAAIFEAALAGDTEKASALMKLPELESNPEQQEETQEEQEGTAPNPIPKEPAGEPTPESPREGEGATSNTTAHQQENGNPDWLERLTDTELRAKVEAVLKERDDFKHRNASAEGRARTASQHIQQRERKIAELQSEFERLSKQPLAASGFAAKIEKDEDLLKLAEADPLFGKALKQFASKIATEVEAHALATQQRIQEVGQAFVRAEDAGWVAEQQAIVREAIPHIDEVVSHPAFKVFLDNAPPGLKQLAVSPDARDAFHVLEVYQNWGLQNGVFQAPENTQQQQVVQEAQAAPAAQQAPARAGGVQQKIIDSRARRAGVTPTPKSTPSPTPTPGDFDEDEWFNKGRSSIR
jgi:hypothetical protein